jgi:hypothetical protein
MEWLLGVRDFVGEEDSILEFINTNGEVGSLKSRAAIYQCIE